MSPGEKPPSQAFGDLKWHCHVWPPGRGFRQSIYLPHPTSSCLFPPHLIPLLFSTSTSLLSSHPHLTLIPTPTIFSGNTREGSPGPARVPSLTAVVERVQQCKQLPQADRHIAQWPEPDGNASGGCHTMWCIISMVLFCQFVTGGEPSMIIRGVLPRHRHLRF